MKNIILFLFCFVSYFASSQKIYSLYFSEPQPKTVAIKKYFEKDIIGTYQKSDDELVDIVIDSTSITVRYTIQMFLTTNEINSNDKFEFKRNLLYGINKKEGLEYFIENDTVYFGVFQKETLFEITDSTTLKKSGANYFLNTKKDDFWDVTLLYIKGKILYLRTIDITEESKKVKEHLSPLKTDFVGKEKTYISSPLAKSFLNFVLAKGFYDIVKYVKR